MPHYIGLDLGGTNLKAGLTDAFGRPLAKLSVPTRADEGPDAVLEVMAQVANDVAKRADLALDKIDAIGVGAPGMIDFDAGIVLAAPNLRGFRDVHVVDRVAAATGRPVVLENDANAAAMGEFWAGAGQDPTIKHLIMLTLGTGIGSGIVIDGHVLHGGFGFGGEIGHMIIDPTKPRHTSGSPGCLEQLASAHATGRLAMELIDAGRPSALAAVYQAQGELTARDVFDAAKAGDALAEQVVDQVVHYLGMACVNLCRLFDPQMIVFAGGMILAGQYLFDRVIAAYHELNWTVLPSKVRIEPAQLGNDAGIIGAAAVAWEAHQAGRVG